MRCCCVPSVTLDVQGPQLGATVFLQGPSGFTGRVHNYCKPISSLPGVPLQACALHVATFFPTWTLMPTWWFCWEQFNKQVGTHSCIITTQIPLQNNWIPFPSVGSSSVPVSQNSHGNILGSNFGKCVKCGRTCYLLNPKVIIRVGFISHLATCTHLCGHTYVHTHTYIHMCIHIWAEISPSFVLSSLPLRGRYGSPKLHNSHLPNFNPKYYFFT